MLGLNPKWRKWAWRKTRKRITINPKGEKVPVVKIEARYFSLGDYVLEKFGFHGEPYDQSVFELIWDYLNERIIECCPPDLPVYFPILLTSISGHFYGFYIMKNYEFPEEIKHRVRLIYMGNPYYSVWQSDFLDVKANDGILERTPAD